MAMVRTSGPRRLLLLSPLLALALALASPAHAQTPAVLLGTADSFAVLAGSTITNTGPTRINGDLGLHPGVAVTGFPPGTVNGAMHTTDAVAQRAETDLATTAYNDAAGRPFYVTSPPDVGALTLTAGVYRTGSVPSLGLTGNLTLDAQGDPNAVFIFQIASTLITATDSRVSLVNGAQACNVFWQVGSSATLGTRTAFKGTIMALTSISATDGVTVDGRLLARNGAVTLINDTVTRPQCAVGSGPTSGIGPGTRPISGGGGGPRVRISGIPGARRLGARRRGARQAVCAKRGFTARFRLRDSDGIRRVKVYRDGKLVRRSSRARFSLRIAVRRLRAGGHRLTVVALDRAGNVSVTRLRFERCAPR